MHIKGTQDMARANSTIDENELIKFVPKIEIKKKQVEDTRIPGDARVSSIHSSSEDDEMSAESTGGSNSNEGEDSDYLDAVMDNDQSLSDEYTSFNKEDSSACVGECTSKLKNTLKEWINEEKHVPHYSVTRLLIKLKKDFPLLPVSCKSLIPKNPDYRLQEMHLGQYVHFEWISAVMKYCEENLKARNLEELSLIVNVDGLPLFNNSLKYVAYPILFKIIDAPQKTFCAGIYCSNKVADGKKDEKVMPAPSELLHDFLKDISDNSEGIVTDSGLKSIKLGIFCCDAPVRASLKAIIGHSGYNSCERCVQHGDRVCAVILPSTGCPLRTDESFTLKSDPDHHHGRSCLEDQHFPMVSGFVLDYMHSAALGTMKRLLSHWCSINRHAKKTHLSTRQKSLFDSSLAKIRFCIPSEFNRKLEGGINKFSRWKASELRNFMLYIGVVLLADEDIISPKIYRSFLCFSIAMKILLSEAQDENMPVVKSLMQKFIKLCISQYGKSFVAYNIHSMEHLDEDYSRYGNLEHVSAFAFESFLGTEVKGVIRSGYQPLKQICASLNRHNFSEFKETESTVRVSRECQCSHLNFGGSCHRNVVLESGTVYNVAIDSKTKDSCFLTVAGDVCLVYGIHKTHNEFKFIVKKFINKSNFFDVPTPSSDVGVYSVSKISSTQCIVREIEIASKMMLLPYKNVYVAQSLLHDMNSKIQSGSNPS